MQYTIIHQNWEQIRGVLNAALNQLIANNTVSLSYTIETDTSHVIVSYLTITGDLTVNGNLMVDG